MHLLFADKKKIMYKHSLQHERINHYRGTKATNVPLMYPHERLHHRTYFFYRLLHFWILYRSFETGHFVACFRWDTCCTVISRVHPFCDDHISSLFNLTLHAQMKCFRWNIVICKLQKSNYWIVYWIARIRKLKLGDSTKNYYVLQWELIYAAWNVDIFVFIFD